MCNTDKKEQFFSENWEGMQSHRMKDKWKTEKEDKQLLLALRVRRSSEGAALVFRNEAYLFRVQRSSEGAA
jgi:hypothetical protein